MVKGSSRVTDHWLDQVEAGGVEVSKKDVSKEKLKSLEHLAVLSALTGDCQLCSSRVARTGKALEGGQERAAGISGGGKTSKGIIQSKGPEVDLVHLRSTREVSAAGLG